MSDFEKLVGKKVESIMISSTSTSLLFSCDDGKMMLFEAEGDCCSASWFADIINPSCLLGRVITGVSDISMNDVVRDLSRLRAHIVTDDNRTVHDVLQYCANRLFTDAGYCDIIYRNDSNGYYGGFVRSPEEFEGIDTTHWKQIYDDWSA
jgi:hypothetical protein